MRNQLVQTARTIVDKIQKQRDPFYVTYKDIEEAKNAIAEAFPNAALEEQEFLAQYGDELNQLEGK